MMQDVHNLRVLAIERAGDIEGRNARSYDSFGIQGRQPTDDGLLPYLPSAKPQRKIIVRTHTLPSEPGSLKHQRLDRNSSPTAGERIAHKRNPRRTCDYQNDDG